MAWDAMASGYPSVKAPNGQAILPLSVAAGTRTLTLYGYANFIPAPSVNSDFGIGIYVDGVYSTELTPTVNGPQALSVALDGAAHSIDVVSAYRNYYTPSTAFGNWISGYQGATLRAVAAPTSRGVIYGDSIALGAFAQPVPQLSWAQRSRALFPGRISLEAYGGRQLLDDTNGTSGGLANLDALAARLVALAQLGGAATTKWVWCEIGYNDWHNTTMTAAAHTANLASLYDKIHALDSAITIYAQTLIVTSTEAATNGNGDTPPAWRTAQAAAASGRSWVTVVPGLNLMAVGGLNADGVHPSTVGHQAIALGTGAQAGSASVRAVVGF